MTTNKTTKTPAARKVAAKKVSAEARVRRAKRVVAEQVQRTSDAREDAGDAIRQIKPGWLVAGGVISGALVAVLPVRVVAATAGALAGLAVRLFNTPLGPMAIGAALARRDKDRGQNSPEDDRPG